MFDQFYTPTPMLGVIFGILVSVTPSASIFRLLSFFPCTCSVNFEVAGHFHSFLKAQCSSISIPYSTAQILDDLEEVIPWILSLFLFVIFPVGMKLSNALRDKGIGFSLKDGLKPPKIISKCLRLYRKKISKDDLKKNRQSADSYQESSKLAMPSPGTILNADTNVIGTATIRRDYVGSCAICLSSYEQGDVIVWSSNCACRDVFHEECFMTWAQRNGEPSCPCCRQDFVTRKLMDEVIMSVNKEEIIFHDNTEEDECVLVNY